MTANHIFNLVALGCYTTNHFFRVDKNFVAQNADVVSGRLIPLNAQQKVGCSFWIEHGLHEIQSDEI